MKKYGRFVFRPRWIRTLAHLLANLTCSPSYLQKEEIWTNLSSASKPSLAPRLTAYTFQVYDALLERPLTTMHLFTFLVLSTNTFLLALSALHLTLFDSISPTQECLLFALVLSLSSPPHTGINCLLRSDTKKKKKNLPSKPHLRPTCIPNKPMKYLVITVWGPYLCFVLICICDCMHE